MKNIVQIIKNNFFILEGNNGASYIVNIKDANSILLSLKFYKARTIKQKVMKNALKLYLNSLVLFCKMSICGALQDRNQVNQYLKKLTNIEVDFELDKNCSILISPTRDKVIVHHHGQYFHKFAFGKSVKKVKKEAEIYKLLDKPFYYFETSKFQDYVDDDNHIFSFKLAGQRRKSTKTDINLTLALVEFFNVSRKEGGLFSSYLENLRKRVFKNTLTSDAIESVLNQLEATYKKIKIPVGLVHRDFKPWNINDEHGLLIYDFEETVTDGLPLEDLLNYHIDPIVRYLPSSKVAEAIFNKDCVNEYKRYLETLKINLDFQILLYCYLIERVIFWRNAGEQETSKKYCDLFEYIVMEY